MLQTFRKMFWFLEATKISSRDDYNNLLLDRYTRFE